MQPRPLVFITIPSIRVASQAGSRWRVIPLVALATVITIGLTVVQGPRPAAAAADDQVNERAVITYSLHPAQERVEVTARVTYTNLVPNEGYTRIYIDEWGPVLVPADAQGFRVSGKRVKAFLHHKDASERAYGVRFPRIFRGQSVSFTATWNLPSRGADSASPTRITEAYSHFCWHGQPVDTGSVTATVPRAYEAVTSISPVRMKKRQRSLRLTATKATDVSEFYACTDAYDPARLSHAELTSPAGHLVVIGGWPGDDAWQTAATDSVAVAAKGVEDVIGAPIPGDDPIRVREVAKNALHGYAGKFDSESSIIQLSEEGADVLLVSHELAHAWFNHTTLAANWLWEGLAEWAARTVVGRPCAEPGPYPGSGSPRLAKWLMIGSKATVEEEAVVDYQYAAACAVMSRVSDAMGAETMRDVVAALLNGQSPYDWLGAPDGASGQDLASLSSGIASIGSGTADAVIRDGTLPATAGWSPTASQRRRTKPVDWRQWLDIVDEIGLVRAGVDDLAFAEDLLVREGIASSRKLRGRQAARAAFHELQGLGPGQVTPVAVRRALDDWRFDDAHTLIELADMVARDILAAPGTVAEAEPIWAAYEMAGSREALVKLRDRLPVSDDPLKGRILLTDDFSSAAGWQAVEGGTVRRVNGRSLVELVDGYGTGSTRELPSVSDALTATGLVVVDSSSGLAGWMCGSPDGWLIGTVGPAGWSIRSYTDVWLTLASGRIEAGLEPAVGAPFRVQLECGNASADGEVRLFVDGTLLGRASHTMTVPWTAIGAWANAERPPMHAWSDDLLVFGEPYA